MHIIKRYLDNGYIDMKSIIEEPDLPFMFLWGGRATGKTYGALKWADNDFNKNGSKYIYLRRTDRQLDECMRIANNPFKQINIDTGASIYPLQEKNYGRCFFKGEEHENGKIISVGEPHGYMLSLSTIGNIRGLSYSDVGIVIYDEFMKMPTEKTMKNEGFAFADMYESINRNREFTGAKPLKAICLSNANDLANDLFIYYQLVDHVQFMIKHNKYQYLDYGRGFALLRFDDSPISAQKQNTSLYRFSGENSEYNKFAVNNTFKQTEIPTIKSQPLNEYKPIVNINGLYIYEHKSESKYYCTYHKSGNPPKYDSSDIDRTRFCRKYFYLWTAHLEEIVYFETYEIYRIFEKIFLNS